MYKYILAFHNNNNYHHLRWRFTTHGLSIVALARNCDWNCLLSSQHSCGCAYARSHVNPLLSMLRNVSFNKEMATINFHWSQIHSKPLKQCTACTHWLAYQILFIQICTLSVCALPSQQAVRRTNFDIIISNVRTPDVLELNKDDIACTAHNSSSYQSDIAIQYDMKDNAKCEYIKKENVEKIPFQLSRILETLLQIIMFWWQPANAKWKILHAELMFTEHELLPQNSQ